MEKKQVTFEIHGGVESVYSNVVRIGHLPGEILLDFIQVIPGEKVGKVNSRVVMTPLNAKLLMKALMEHIAVYESKYGVMILPPVSLADQLFTNVKNNNNSTQGSEGEKPNGTT